MTAWINDYRHDPNEPGQGAYNDRIADLMLAGLKPVCSVSGDYAGHRVPELLRAVEYGQLRCAGPFERKSALSQKTYKEYLFCQPGQEGNMMELVRLFNDAHSGQIAYTEEYHRRVGTIFGYSEIAIDRFVKRTPAP